MADTEDADVSIFDSIPNIPVIFVKESFDKSRITMSVLKKVSFGNLKKWIQVPTETGDAVEYKDFVETVKIKFGFAKTDNVIVQDAGGVEIEEDVFSFFSKSNEFTIVIGTASAVVENQNRSLEANSLSLRENYTDYNSDDSNSNFERTIEGNVQINEASPPKRRFSISNLKEALIENTCGAAILEEYNGTSMLTIQSRRQLVNIAVDRLVKVCGSYPTKEEKINCAKSIIEEFPSLRDPMSTEGYEAFYDPPSKSGYIVWRLKTLNRHKPENKNTNSLDSATQSGLEPEKGNTTGVIDATNGDPDVLKEKLTYMKNACKKLQKKEILEILEYSFTLRRTEPKKIIENFPRFLDIPYLINEDFALMFPGVVKTDFKEDRIFEVANRNLTKKLSKEEQGWDSITEAHIYLLKLLPQTNRRIKKKKTIDDDSSVNQMIIFHQNGIPIDDVKLLSSQPCLIAVGINKTAIISYYIALDGQKLPIDAKLPSEAFDTLFKAHFVFDTEFHASLNVMFQFIQVHYYHMNSKIKFSPKMREVRTWLTMNTEE